ncbi:MAG TPA: LytR C-terminal domain-containing protein [Rhodocyclaceae bacterium]|nr:LytR C-terminal domain-containing protein [Rhodocyclaceae bacterium]
MQTEIQYRPGYERQARSLNELMARPSRLVASERLRSTVAVRVVLGRDVARRPLFAEAAARSGACGLG